MYDEKEKREDKLNPFASDLRPKEEVLWFSVPKQPRLGFWYQAILYLVVLAVIGGIIGFSVISDTSLRPQEQMNIVGLVVGGVGAIMLVILLIQGLYRLFTRNRPAERAYAVTNERLLYRDKKNVASIPLEHLPSVSLFLGDGNKGTFSFGALFPMWPDVDDAIRIKHLIDDAQKKRMQRL